MKRLKKAVLISTLAATIYGCSAPAENATPLESDRPADSRPAQREPTFNTSIPAGTRLAAVLTDPLGTDSSAPNDFFAATLGEPVVVDGRTVLEAGTRLRGRVVDVQESARVRGLASIRLVLAEILLDSGSIAIRTTEFSETAGSTEGRDAGIIAGGAGVGAAIGAIAGGAKGAAVGAIAGGGAGTGAVLATDGDELHYPSGTRIAFTLAAGVAF